MELYAVVSTIGGFAREDAARPHCVGVFTDKTVAEHVKLLSGVGAEIKTIELDAIPPGLARTAEEMGFVIGQPRAGRKPGTGKGSP